MSPDTSRPVEILLVEDSPSDAALTLHAFRNGKLANRVHHVTHGDDAMRFLQRESPFDDVPTPDIVLLDLNLPRKNGREILRDIRADPELRHLPVIVLTSSDEEGDVLDAYREQTNAYIVKPVDLEKFFDVVQQIEHFWFSVVRRPQLSAG